MNKSYNSTLKNCCISYVKIETKSERIGWVFAFGIASLAILISNALTILAFTKGHFRQKRAYIFLINLAVSDLVIGAIVIPLYISVAFFKREDNRLVYLCFDVTAGFGSVFTVGFISLERLSAVASPLKHRLFRVKHYVVAIICVWLSALVETLLVRIILPYNNFYNAIRAHITIISVATPLLITIAAYSALYALEQKSFARFHCRKNDERDAKLGRTLMMITTVFFLTWSPFVIANVIDIYSCAETMCTHLPEHFYTTSKLLQYTNSFVNPAVYSMRMPAFRESLKIFVCNVFRPKNSKSREKFVQLNLN